MNATTASSLLHHDRLGRAGRVVYTLSQAARIAWFLGQYRLAALRAAPAVRPEDIPPDMPSERAIFARIATLLRQDRANIQAGLYRMPQDWLPRPRAALRTSRRFLADLDAVTRRRAAGKAQEVFETRHTEGRGGYPRYYLQNFHYQSGGWLTDESAGLYDWQVETLFYGTADTMRRQALVPLAEHIRAAAAAGRRVPELRLLDLACGTGRFLGTVKDNWPRLPCIGLDLSPNYLRRARERLRRRSWLGFVDAPAEAIPLADGSLDLVTSIYLFHELPAKVRRRVAAEIARVLRPGGRFVLVDSFQRGDDPPLDPLLEFFPRTYHEPYFRDYVGTDLDALFGAAGLRPAGHRLALFSKVSVYDKPG